MGRVESSNKVFLTVNAPLHQKINNRPLSFFDVRKCFKQVAISATSNRGISQ